MDPRRDLPPLLAFWRLPPPAPVPRWTRVVFVYPCIMLRFGSHARAGRSMALDAGSEGGGAGGRGRGGGGGRGAPNPDDRCTGGINKNHASPARHGGGRREAPKRQKWQIAAGVH